MKKLKLSLLIAFFGMISFVGAQTASFSVKGGLNMSNYYGDELTEKNMKAGFHIGVGADLELTPNVYLQTGLFFSTKGAKYSDKADGDWVDTNVTANYLQLPLHVAYKLDVTPGTKVVFHAGPYVAYGIGGKMKVGPLSVDTFDETSVGFKFDYTVGFKPFDAGLGLGVGAELGKILVDLGWDMGLTNIARVGGDIKNQNAYLSVGYKL